MLITTLAVTLLLGVPPTGAATDIMTEARRRYGDSLTPADITFFDCTARGEIAPGPAGTWGADGTLGADRIAWVCTDPRVATLVTHKGVRVRGVPIKGTLELAYARIPFPLAIENCRVDGDIDLRGAELGSLSLDGSTVGVINGRSLRVTADVLLTSLRNASKVDLSNARISGDVDFTGAKISHPPNQESIYADFMTVGRNVVMANGFRADGKVNLAGATINGDFNCTAGKFSNPGDIALDAGGMYVRGNVYLTTNRDKGYSTEEAQRLFRVDGVTELSNARIGGDLHCAGGQFFLPAKNDNGRMNAIRARGLNVTGDVHFDRDRRDPPNPFRSRGRVELTAAKIGGSLSCEGGEFAGVAGEPLALDVGSAAIGHDVNLGHGFIADGVVCLEGASIGGKLACFKGQFSRKTCPTSKASGGTDVIRAGGLTVGGDASLAGHFGAEGKVDLSKAKIVGMLEIHDIDKPHLLELDLTSATAGTLRHPRDSWPGRGKLWIDGFTYDFLHAQGATSGRDLLEWIGLRQEFSGRPYDQLAAVLRKAGREDEAKKVLIRKEIQKWEEVISEGSYSPWDWLWYRWLGRIIDFGYNPLNAFWYAVTFIALGWIIFGLANRAGVFEFEPRFGQDPRNRHFRPLIYSIDLFTPVISLYTRENWSLRTERRQGDGPLFHAYQVYWIAHIVLGWVVTSLLVAGILGLIRPD